MSPHLHLPGSAWAYESMQPPEPTFGQALRRARTAKRKSLRELSIVLDCSVAYLSDVERDRRSPLSDARILAAEAALGCSPGQLMVPALRGRKVIVIPPTATDEQIRAAIDCLHRDPGAP